LILRAYYDADWAGDPSDRRSAADFCIFLGDSLISWRSKKQTLAARSSTEAEYCALVDTTFEILWLRWLLAGLETSHSSSTDLDCDNQSTIQIAHNDIFHEPTKHIDIHFIRHHLLYCELHLISIDTLDQPVDLFTKSHSPERFHILVSKLKLVEAPPT